MKIVIVEDEIRIREGLRKLIKRANPNYEIVGEAENGEEGFHFIQDKRPDVVITDIKMPVMDGLQMLTKLHKEAIPIRAIVLSAYSEFSYAQLAIKLGVSEYILKPIAVGEITQSLKKIELQLQQVHKNEQEHPKVLKSLDNICSSILNGNIVIDEKLMTFLKVEYEMDTNGSFVFVPCYLGQHYEKSQRKIEKEINGWMQEKKGFSHCIFKIPQNNMVAVLFYQYEEIHGLERWISNCISREKGREESDKKCFGWIEFQGLRELPIALSTLQKYMDWNIVLGEGVLIHYPKITQIQTAPLSYPIEMEKEMREAFCRLQIGKVKEIFEKFARNFQKGEVYLPKEVKESYVRFLWSILNIAKEIDFISLKKVDQQELLEKIMFSVTYDELLAVMQEIMEKIKEEEKKTNSSYMIQRAKSMIHEFYNKGVTLDEIAERLSITPEYLGTQFYKEVGEHFTTYIRNYRIKKAKELLIGTSLKSYQVAEKVGYSDPKYFSKVFKSVTGELPAEYRKRH